ncbi:TPA: hypothetical protein DCE37_18040 [Candidatus Latescibacteria bacterium]|nr:hypothetical protein [Candidatus Latescibacterota bacterium]
MRLERRGEFDTWIGYENNNAQYDCWVRGHDRSGEEVERYKLGEYETDNLTDLLSRTPRLEMPRHRSSPCSHSSHLIHHMWRLKRLSSTMTRPGST